MGWARTLLLGDIGNRLDIEDTERDIEAIRKELWDARKLDHTQDKAIEQLQRENEQLELCLAALLRTLKSRGVLTGDDLTSLVDMLE